METLIGNLGQPLSRLTVHIVEVGELAQGPEILAHVPDAADSDFPFLAIRYG